MSGLKSLKKKRRIQIIILAFVAMAISLTLVGIGFKDGINFYRDPTAVIAEPPSEDEVFRLGGLVVEGSIRPDENVRFFFEVTDGAETIPVHYIGRDPKPDLFNEGQGTIATGQYVNGVFEATEILAKHDEDYMPKEVIDSLKETGVYVEPDGGASGN